MNNYEALDIETVWGEEIAKPICIAITSNNKVFSKIIDKDEIDGFEIINFFLKKCSSKKIYYVHNLTFEIFVFLRYLINKKIKFKIISHNKTVYGAEIWYKKKKIKLRCSYRLTMLSLKNLAKLAGVDEKGVFPYKVLNSNIEKFIDIKEDLFDKKEDYNLFIEKYGKSVNILNILKEYCINDSIITKQSIIKYWEIINEGGLETNKNILTAAKLSVENYFNKNFIIKKKIKIKYDRLLRNNYYGGRTEVFGNPYPEEMLLHFDWSGMYSQCMEEKVLGGEIFESNTVINIEKPGFYWIKFRQNMDIPILPIKKEKLLFANGEFEGWYWFEEIILAIENGVKILSVEKVITGQYYDYFIKDFVKINNDIRKISPLHKQIGKNNNNTFYGRLGMNPERLEEEIVSEINSIKEYEKITEINGAFLVYKKKEKSISNITISAAITAKARIKLYKGMMEVIKVGGRVLYTDTDSIIAGFNKNTYKKFLNVNLGEVCFSDEKEDTVIEDAVFAMPKTYALKYKNKKEIVKIKGFNAKPSFNEFKEKFYKRESITTINQEWNKKDLMIKNVQQKKTTNLNSLDKRIWSKNLKTTYPLKL